MEVLATWLEPLNLGPESLFLLAMAPFFLGFIAWEAWYWRNTPAAYSLRDTLNNAFLAASYQLADGIAWAAVIRSEEHTSELQSRENLVCRLLLEKKNEDIHKDH